MAEHPQHHRERRIQARYWVDLHAKVRGRNQAPANCRVHNICSGGVLLQTGADEPELPFQRGEHVDLHFDIPDAQSMDPIQAVIEVVHRVDRGVGARFVRLVGDGRARLARFITETAAAQAPDKDEDQTPSRAKARAVLEEVGQQRLGSLLDSLLETLVEELWGHIERAESDVERAQFTGEVGLLARAIEDDSVPRKLRSEILSSLKDLGRVNADRSGGEAPGASKGDGLALVDQDDFEIWLAKSELTNRLEQELREPLDALRHFIATIFHDSSLPVEPLAFAESLEKALSEAGVGTQLQRLSLQIIANHLARNLGSFYREVMHAWLAAGLSDEVGEGDAGVVSPGSGVGAGAAQDASAYDATETGDVVSEAAGEVPAGAPVGSGPVPGNADGRGFAEAAGIMANILANYAPPLAYRGLDRRQRSYAGGRRIADLVSSLPVGYQMPSADPDRPLRDLVAQLLNASESARTDLPPERRSVMSPQVEERVDVTDRLLALMLADPSTPERVKSVVKPLSTRFLSMALRDNGSIADTKNPLVKLINQLEHLSQFLMNEEDSDKGLRKEFEEIIQQLVSTDAKDEPALDDLSKRVGKLESEAGEEYQGNIANWVNVCEARERARIAKERVRERLNDAFADKRMHKSLEELLRVGWRNLLELVSANLGIEGPRWRKYWRLLLTLYRMTGGATSHDESEDADLGAVLGEVQGALTYIGTDPVVIDELLTRLEAAASRVRASLDRSEDYLVFPAIPVDPESEPDRIPQEIPTEEWDQSMAQVDELPLGAFVWMRAKDASKALRLIWRNEDGSRLALTDTMGKKVKILRRVRLAEAFAKGQARAQAASPKRVVTRAADAALSEMQERLTYQETHDPLTGLANQRRLIGSLTQLLMGEANASNPHVLCFLELDRYDTLTGTYGFSVGEQMLLAVARLLESVVPQAVCIAYLGGSRFGVLLPATDRDHATELGEAVRAGLTVMPFELQEKPFRISGSLGMAMLATDNPSPEKLVSAASVACLAAQREGGDRVVVFSEDNEIIARQLEHMRGWAQAEDVLKAGRRKLRYQRIVPLDPSSELTPHCEILLSVFDEQGMPLPLQSFIAAAEAFNMMREVDRQVIDATFKWVDANPDKVRDIGGVAINLSGQSLGDPGLLSYIRAAIDQWNVPVDMISFEVTETAAIVNLDQAAIILEDIKSLGCRIALDDFGAGMSSYSYLKRLPVDYVKIDGSFVKDILVSPHDREIVKSFNEIAHFMGKKTIAEYVENQEILELLRDIGVDFAQGYAIEKPQFVDDLR